jgi:hypothetical protein
VSRRSVRKHRLRKHGVRRGKTRRQRLLLNAMALGAGSLLAVVAGSVFCPLTLSRRLLRFAAPSLPAAAGVRRVRLQPHTVITARNNICAQTSCGEQFMRSR